MRYYPNELASSHLEPTFEGRVEDVPPGMKPSSPSVGKAFLFSPPFLSRNSAFFSSSSSFSCRSLSSSFRREEVSCWEAVRDLARIIRWC